MRIAFIINQFPALSETFILNQITGLIERGHQVDIYADCPTNQSKVHPDINSYNLPERTYYFSAIPRNKLIRFLKAFKLVFTHLHLAPRLLLNSLNILKYGKDAISLDLLYYVIPFLKQSSTYDIIHCHFGPNGLRALKLMELGRIRGALITSFHGYDVSSHTQMYGLDIYKKLFKDGDLYTVTTEFLLNKVLALGCPKDKIARLPVGVVLSDYLFKERKLSPNEPVKVITVARLVEKKGIEYSIKAFAKATVNHSNAIYRIIGDGPLRQSLENLIAELNLSGKVKLLGWMTQEEVRQLYDDSHIFVLSSVTASDGDQEGQGLVLQEAQAIGLPVLSTLHNGIPDGVLDGKSGFLVPERDVDALAEKLSYLIKHPEVWAKMGRIGRAFVEVNYDIDKLNDLLVQIYQKLLESKSMEKSKAD